MPFNKMLVHKLSHCVINGTNLLKIKMLSMLIASSKLDSIKIGKPNPTTTRIAHQIMRLQSAQTAIHRHDHLPLSISNLPTHKKGDTIKSKYRVPSDLVLESKPYISYLDTDDPIQNSNSPTSQSRLTCLQESNNIIDLVRTRIGVKILPEQVVNEFEDVLQTNSRKKKLKVVVNLCSVTVAIPAEIPEDPQQANSQCTNAVGVGKAKCLTEARKKARIDLANRLLFIFPDIASKSVKKTDELNSITVPVALSPPQRNTLKSMFEYFKKDAAGIFNCDFASNNGVESSGISHQYSQRCSTRKNFEGSPLDDEAIQIRDSNLPSKPVGSKLPIWAMRKQIAETICNNRVTMITASTGSGKTTQIPQFILDYIKPIGDSRPASVLVTQPRRIAAISISERVTEERKILTSNQIASGESCVGYSVRFESRPPRGYHPEGTILFCTSGILLRRMHIDPELLSITHIILDEVHERDVNTDLLLLLIRELLSRRSDLRLILMSATMEAKKIAEYFENHGFSVGTVLDIEGTNFPVQEIYLNELDVSRYPKLSVEATEFIKAELSSCPPPSNEMDLTSGPNSLIAKNNLKPSFCATNNEIVIKDSALKQVPMNLIASIVVDIGRTQPPGAILVFLPGWEEIKEAHNEILAAGGVPNAEYYLLHSSLPHGSSDGAFYRPKDPNTRKVVLATNIAESSVTIPDVVYVVDSGRQRVMFYDQRNRMDVLETCWVTRANLRQRLGRAGRCQPGKYIGIMSRTRALSLPTQTEPEIRRLGLDEVCLTVLASGAANKRPVAAVMADAIDPPNSQSVLTSMSRLHSLGAYDLSTSNDLIPPNGQNRKRYSPSLETLTPLGRLLANLPMHPALGKMLVTSVFLKCLSPILTAVAGMGQRLFLPARLPDEKQALHQFYKQNSPSLYSDHLLHHNLLGEDIMRNYDSGRLLSHIAIRRISESRLQIVRELKSHLGDQINETSDKNSSCDGLVRLVLASGLYPDVAVWRGKRNNYRLRLLNNVSSATMSSCHQYSGNTQSFGMNQMRLMRSEKYKNQKNSIETEERPSFYIFEDLIDIGQKMISKMTAIDPVFLALLATNTMFKSSESMTDKSGNFSICLDGWINLRPGENQDPNLNDVRIITELRTHWETFLQFMTAKTLLKMPLNKEEQEAADRFLSAMTTFAQSCDIKRPLSK